MKLVFQALHQDRWGRGGGSYLEEDLGARLSERLKMLPWRVYMDLIPNRARFSRDCMSKG